MSSFSLFEVFLLLGIGQGLFLVFAITAVQNPNRPANKILQLIILFATVMLLGRVFSFFLQYEWVIRFAQFVDACIFLFGPLVYLYISRLSNPTAANNPLSFWHFLPALVHLSFSIWTSFMSMTELNEMYWTSGLMYVLLGVQVGGLTSLIAYGCVAYILVRRTRKESDASLAVYLNETRKYVNSLLLSIAATSLFWMLSLAGTVWEIWPITLISYELLWAVTPFFFYSLGYYGLLQPSILRIPVLPKAQRDRLDFSEAQALKAKLNYLMHEERLFEQSDLTLKALAECLETSPNNLSWLFNKVHQKSFYDYINEIRVKEFQEKVTNNEHHAQTLFALALDVGFNSKSTFNKSFKSVIGETPSEYVKKITPKEYEGTQ